jgi:hypothetical protein
MNNQDVVLEEDLTRVALTERSAYRHTGRAGSTETVYGMVHRVVSHPFTEGATVTIGGGKTRWTIIDVGSQFVRVRSLKGTERFFIYDGLTQLNLAVNS